MTPDQAPAPTTAQPAVEEYLSQLSVALRVPRRARRAIIVEIADGLTCAINAEVDRGATEVDAAGRALAEFGDPLDLAVLFNQEQARVTASHVGVGLLASGPLVGLAWVTSRAGGGSSDMADRILTTLTSTTWIPVALAVSVPSAIVATAAAGRLGRVLPAPRSTAITAACIATLACVAADAMLITAALQTGRTGIGAFAWLPVVASALRLTVAMAAGRRCLHLRAAVN